MAKDGTNRGGRRIRAGDKPEALADKIDKGKAATIIDLPTPALEGAELNDAADLTGEDMPNPSDYLSARQRDGKPLGADDLFRQTSKWLKDRGCERLVNPRLLEAYAQHLPGISSARKPSARMDCSASTPRPAVPLPVRLCR